MTLRGSREAKSNGPHISESRESKRRKMRAKLTFKSHNIIFSACIYWLPAFLVIRSWQGGTSLLCIHNKIESGSKESGGHELESRLNSK